MNENTLSLNINLNNLNETDRANLLALVDKASKPKSKVWKPADYEKYYVISHDGDIYDFDWDDDASDNRMYDLGNCFKTEEKAAFTAEAIKTYVALKRYAEEHNERATAFDGINTNYVITYHTNELVVMSMCHVQNIADIYFTSIKIAKAAIAEIGENRIKKYLFGVDNHDC